MDDTLHIDLEEEFQSILDNKGVAISIDGEQIYIAFTIDKLKELLQLAIDNEEGSGVVGLVFSDPTIEEILN